MAKPTPEKPAAGDGKSSGDGKKKSKKKQQDGFREITESFVVAFVLAFLFRAFEAEAFVIPTGSMAPTLVGRHKEATCEVCRFHFSFGASDELDEDGHFFLPGRRIESALCPNCRFDNPVRELPAFKGDRIIVNKFPFELGEPQRWDVTVFKYPEKPTTNYIKRLVGLPGETLVIKRGDVYRQESDRSLTILRKAPGKQRELQIPVYDNNHQEAALHELGWPKRWAAVELGGPQPDPPAGKLAIGPVANWSEAQDSWDEETESFSFYLSSDRAAGSLQWLRYRHIVPSQDDWELVHVGNGRPRNPDFFFRQAEPSGPRPQIVTDFCGYNSYTGGNGNIHDDCFWVGDLTLSVTADIQSVADGAELVLELNEGARCYRCRIDVHTGKARLMSLIRLQPDREEEDLLAEADCGINATGEYDIKFANVDDRLCLWVDGSLVDFGAKAEYRVDESIQPGPRESDLTPIGIAAQGLAIRVSDLLIERDIYYRASQIDVGGERMAYVGDDEHPDQYALRRAVKNPTEWASTYLRSAREARFELEADEFLMLGDNSPRSQDSRVWPNSRGADRRYAVPRSALVGRAFFVYWPHGVPFLNDGQGFPLTHLTSPDGTERYPDLRVPFYPNILSMRRIR